VDEIAEAYVRLTLALGLHDQDYVDAYYGPPGWRSDVEESRPSLAEIERSAQVLVEQLTALRTEPGTPESQRQDHLLRQVRSLRSRAMIVGGSAMSFDAESEALYGAVAPRLEEAHFADVLAELDRLLPGSGDIAERHATFAAGHVVPAERLPAVFEVAIDACRERTLQHLELPPEESFDLEFVTGYSWGAQNWYQGGGRSRILVNTEVPLRTDRVLDLACHEGYPGHHVASLMMEQHLVRDRAWLEFTVFPLYSPMALIMEGTAMLAVEVAFPGAERLAFDQEIVYPAAGLDPAGAEQYGVVRALVDRLGHAPAEGARRYLDGQLTPDELVQWLVSYALQTPEQARLRRKFIEQYRSYIINYSVGLDVVRRHLGTEDDPDRRWAAFETLLRMPGAALG
jgi:hypothetical protein